jgi:hypothetical protein
MKASKKSFNGTMLENRSDPSAAIDTTTASTSFSSR